MLFEQNLGRQSDNHEMKSDSESGVGLHEHSVLCSTKYWHICKYLQKKAKCFVDKLSSSQDLHKLCHFVSTGACEARGGQGHGQPHQCLRLSRMLSQDKRRCEGGLRDGHQGRTAGQETWQEERVPAVIEASTWTGRRQGKGEGDEQGPREHRKGRDGTGLGRFVFQVLMYWEGGWGHQRLKVAISLALDP